MIWHSITLFFAAMALYTEDTGGIIWWFFQVMFVLSLYVVNAALDQKSQVSEGNQVETINDISRLDHGLTVDKRIGTAPELDIFKLKKGVDYD